ncbi:protein YgfX [Thiogranum longum]|uniref:protein YgfX n=1 Tax=Thiogranum longum TaxID=1537524 RepID=UPI00104A58EF|nr:protein YgfX [Thiogranum longum]
MWNRFDRPLRLELGNSPLLLKILLALHMAGISAWLLVPLSPVLRGLAVVILFGQFCRLYRLHVSPLARYAVQALYWEQASGWKIKITAGWYPATVCVPFYVTSQLVAIRFRTGRFRKVTVIVVGDRTGADDFRRLRVRLLQCAHGRRDRAKIPGQE